MTGNMLSTMRVWAIGENQNPDYTDYLVECVDCGWVSLPATELPLLPRTCPVCDRRREGAHNRAQYLPVPSGKEGP